MMKERLFFMRVEWRGFEVRFLVAVFLFLCMCSNVFAVEKYSVRKGDTLMKIALRHNISYERLCALNGRKKGWSMIKPGERIIVSEDLGSAVCDGTAPASGLSKTFQNIGDFPSFGELPRGVKLSDAALAVVDVKRQKMFVRAGGAVFSYVVSTAKAGVGAMAHSGKTPPGWHRVHSRFGADAMPGQLFSSRSAVGGVVRSGEQWRSPVGDEVLTRILWLEGMESGVNKDPKGNCDSFLRYIYIHGTNQEHLLGTPASHGCIRMGNYDVIELFNLVAPYKNFYVYIKE